MSSIVGRLTEKQVDDFCQELRRRLLEEVSSQNAIYLEIRPALEEVMPLDYGMTPIDLRITGFCYTAEIGKPAEKRECDFHRRKDPRSK